MEYDAVTKVKALQLNRSSDITEDTYIWRLCSVDYLLKDIENNTNTLVVPRLETQNDASENPLISAIMDLDNQKQCLFKDLMSRYYAQCWSLKDNLDWNDFGTKNDIIRIKCSATKLFDRMMNLSDRFYSMNYYMHTVKYEQQSIISLKFSNGNFLDFLDPNGKALVDSVMTLQDFWANESEVRLLYIHQPQANNPFPTTHNIHGDINQYCSHVLDWRDLIEEYELSPNNSDKHESLQKLLKHYGAVKKC